jgi:hypothetical protein
VAIQECKREHLNHLFSRLNIESQNMLTQKDAVEVKIVDLAQEKVQVMKAKADLE